MTKRMFKWRHDRPPVEVPSVAAFMHAYEALCREHGMRFDPEECGDGYMQASIIKFDDSIGELEIDDLERIADIPEAFEIRERLRAEDQVQQDVLTRQRAEEIAATIPDDPVKALELALKSLLAHDQRRAEAALEKALDKLMERG